MLTIVADKVDFLVGTASVFFFGDCGWGFEVWLWCVVFLLFCNEITGLELCHDLTTLYRYAMLACERTVVMAEVCMMTSGLPSSSSPSASFSVVSSSAVSSC